MRFIFLSVVYFIALIPGGRRGLSYTLITCAFAGFRFSGWSPRLTPTKKILLWVGFVSVIVFSALFFYALRLASREANGSEGSQATTSIAPIIPILMEDILTDPGYILRESRSNMEERPFLLMEYLSLLGKGGNMPIPLYGQDIMLAVEMSIPDAVYTILGENKQGIRDIGTEENLANEHFGIPDLDNANSILTAGIIDFGLVGVFLYPLAACFILRAVYAVVDRFFNAEGQVVAVLIAVFLFLQAEVDIGEYVQNFRNIAIVMILWRAIYELPTMFRLSAANVGGSEEASASAP